MDNNRTAKPKAAGRRSTFKDILEDTRVGAARQAWERAKLASLYRKAALNRGYYWAMPVLSEIKCAAARRAYELAPEHVTIGIDDDFHLGLPSIRWAGRGRLHLPAAADLGRWVPCHGARAMTRPTPTPAAGLYLRTA